jgi:hypothetical protein
MRKYSLLVVPDTLASSFTISVIGVSFNVWEQHYLQFLETVRTTVTCELQFCVMIRRPVELLLATY